MPSLVRGRRAPAPLVVRWAVRTARVLGALGVVAWIAAACGAEADGRPGATAPARASGDAAADPIPDAAADMTAARAPDDAGDGAPAPECPRHEIAFSQETGCENDGSVEFCVPAADAALRGRLTTLAPGLTCAPGVGRARCDRAAELLCLLRTDSSTCVEPRGALTDAAWSLICLIASEPSVEQIVSTLYE